MPYIPFAAARPVDSLARERVGGEVCLEARSSFLHGFGDAVLQRMREAKTLDVLCLLELRKRRLGAVPADEVGAIGSTAQCGLDVSASKGFSTERKRTQNMRNLCHLRSDPYAASAHHQLLPGDGDEACLSRVGMAPRCLSDRFRARAR